MGALNLKPGVTVTKLKIKPGAFRQIRTSPATISLLDRIVATISNAALRGAEANVAGEDIDLWNAGFETDGTTSKGNRGRYRASVRTSNFEGVWAEYRYKALTRALVEVAGKWNPDAKADVGRAVGAGHAIARQKVKDRAAKKAASAAKRKATLTAKKKKATK